VHRTKEVFVVILIMALTFNGCSSWRAATPPSVSDPGGVLLVMKNSETIELSYAYIKGDTIYGRGPRSETNIMGNERLRWDGSVAIPVSDVLEFQRRQLDTTKTAGLIVGLTMVIGGAMAARMAFKQWSENFYSWPSD
jgi:hypothetical protein